MKVAFLIAIVATSIALGACRREETYVPMKLGGQVEAPAVH